MANFEVVQRLEPPDDLNQVVPNSLFADSFFSVLLLLNLGEHVAAVGILHHDAEMVRGVIEKGFFEANYIWVVDGGEDAHFVDCILFFGSGELLHLHFFHSVYYFVVFPRHLVHFLERARACHHKKRVKIRRSGGSHSWRTFAN